ncbi:MAG TPA: 4Fe-4S dicluster domain-containing protein [Phycisphaerae bacterium]|nr:4Fe-4S dicluster domain-containing protein [Phycisphaerae bacterium]
MVDEPNDKPHGRRAMFRLGLKRLVEPLAGYIEQRFDVAQFRVRSVLRPPGALQESEFLRTCYRCGNCSDVCPARAIRKMSSDDPELTGTPYIDPDLAACVVCEELACMKTCPSGALKLVGARGDIEMGLARWQPRACLRTQGDPCTLCVDKCPLGAEALAIGPAGEIQVRETGCVGCGTCQFYCPVLPKAIVVYPT